MISIETGQSLPNHLPFTVHSSQMAEKRSLKLRFLLRRRLSIHKLLYELRRPLFHQLNIITIVKLRLHDIPDPFLSFNYSFQIQTLFIQRCSWHYLILHFLDISNEALA